MSDWQPIETAPKDGTMIEAQNRRSSKTHVYKTFWGTGKPHNIQGHPTLDGYQPPKIGYVVNKGKPWWMSEEGIKMSPTPTHWRHINETDQ